MKRATGWRRRWLRLVAGCVCLLLLGGPAREGSGATLSSLLLGGTLDVANARFSQWQVLEADATSGTIDFAQIQVNPFVTSTSLPGIQFLPGTQLSISGINAIDLVLRYRVDALPGTSSFTSQTAELTSLTFGGASEIAYLSSEMSDGVAADLGSTVVYADNGADVVQLVDTQAFAAKSRLFVTTNVFVTGMAVGDQATIGSFVQRFAQNGAAGKPGDYNQNGAVDAADYTVWRDKVGAAAGTLPNDTAGGVIGAAQYNLWKVSFGVAGVGAGSGAQGPATATAIPEPATILTLLWAAAMVWIFSCRRDGVR